LTHSLNETLVLQAIVSYKYKNEGIYKWIKMRFNVGIEFDDFWNSPVRGGTDSEFTENCPPLHCFYSKSVFAKIAGCGMDAVIWLKKLP